jgi:ABC-2 type transport system ATP-binding protein
VSALEIHGVSHTYRKPALRGVSFSIEPGDFVVLLGLNGAGKTTLFSLIAGLLNLQQGSIRVLGHELPGGRAPHSPAAASSSSVGADLDLTVAQSPCHAARTVARLSTRASSRSSSVSALLAPSICAHPVRGPRRVEIARARYIGRACCCSTRRRRA